MRFEEELLLKQQERADHINKSIETPIEDYLEKSRSGIYSNTPENRKLGRVGQKYGTTSQDTRLSEIDERLDLERARRESAKKYTDKIKNIVSELGDKIFRQMCQ